MLLLAPATSVVLHVGPGRNEACRDAFYYRSANSSLTSVVQTSSEVE